MKMKSKSHRTDIKAELKKSIAYKQKMYMSYAINVKKPLKYNENHHHS